MPCHGRDRVQQRRSDGVFMRLVAPFGFYGSGNIGDEATLLGFGRLIERFGGSIGVDVASSDPSHTKRVEPAFRYYQYVDGIMGVRPRRAEKIGRNDPCSCGSGKKYKKCCGVAA